MPSCCPRLREDIRDRQRPTAAPELNLGAYPSRENCLVCHNRQAGYVLA